MKIQKDYEICMPEKTYIGPGSFHKLQKDFAERKIGRCLIVTDKFLASSEVGKTVTNMLDSCQVKYSIYDEVKANPLIAQVAEGVKAFYKEGCDCIVSLGGGSAHDCAKGMKATIINDQESHYKKVLFIAINTTAGTGSEVTKFSIITDEKTHYKLTLIDDSLMPDIAVNDPKFMVGMPLSLTSTTGMDALTHAIESYTSVGANPFTKANALYAIKMIFESLEQACKDGNDMGKRTEMAYAQYLAGLAFSNSGLGMVHAMAHQLGGLYNLPHGLCNAVLLPYVMEYNMDVCSKEYCEISVFAQTCQASTGEKFGATRLIRAIQTLNEKIKIPKTLKGFNVDVKDAEKLAEMALKDASLACNAKQPTKQQLIDIYLKILK